MCYKSLLTIATLAVSTFLSGCDNPTQISAGGGHVCAVTQQGNVYCSGENTDGQINVPSSLADASLVSSGNNHTCALTTAGVECWGSDTDGQSTVPSLTNPTHVSAGRDHTCALDDNGVSCWGANTFSQNTVPTLINPTEVETGGFSACAIDDTGVVCWGSSFDWTGGSPWTQPSVTNPSQLSVGTDRYVVLHSGGVYSEGDPDSCCSQGKPSDFTGSTYVAAGEHWDMCAIIGISIECWSGQGGTVSDRPKPSFSNPSQVSVGSDFLCALDDDGVKCWGGHSAWTSYTRDASCAAGNFSTPGCWQYSELIFEP
ncbi:MAG: hypothetical protein KUG82_12380 [Pseudomonadales bacterium]|nr:hypothetical protein [Pseudomonadales bacterium]